MVINNIINKKIMEYFIIFYLLILIMSIEIFAFIWHKFFAHNHNFRGINDTHFIPS